LRIRITAIRISQALEIDIKDLFDFTVKTKLNEQKPNQND
jgi:hypothetical protein